MAEGKRYNPFADPLQGGLAQTQQAISALLVGALSTRERSMMPFLGTGLLVHLHKAVPSASRVPTVPAELLSALLLLLIQPSAESSAGKEIALFDSLAMSASQQLHLGRPPPRGRIPPIQP